EGAGIFERGLVESNAGCLDHAGVDQGAQDLVGGFLGQYSGGVGVVGVAHVGYFSSGGQGLGGVDGKEIELPRDDRAVVDDLRNALALEVDVGSGDPKRV